MIIRYAWSDGYLGFKFSWAGLRALLVHKDNQGLLIGSGRLHDFCLSHYYQWRFLYVLERCLLRHFTDDCSCRYLWQLGLFEHQELKSVRIEKNSFITCWILHELNTCMGIRYCLVAPIEKHMNFSHGFRASLEHGIHTENLNTRIFMHTTLYALQYTAGIWRGRRCMQGKRKKIHEV
jgi:hypothetical protein